MSDPPLRKWPLLVRRARAEDRAAVLSFASTTWDGWDYIPRAWTHWLAADDGVVLVATAGRAADGAPALDADGAEVPAGRPVAVARVAMLAPGEAWLEGIRVDPRMRGLGVATDMQVAELRWAAASGARIVRYATGERNEASHRLGGRHGFTLAAAFRLWQWRAGGGDGDGDEEEEGEDVSGFDEDARRQANAIRASVLDGLAGRRLIAAPSDGDALWARISADATFRAGLGLCEVRGWALQELTRPLLDRHLERGEVIAVGGEGPAPWAAATLVRDAPPAEDADVKLGLLVGHGEAALELVEEVRRLAGGPISFWLPDPDPPLLAGMPDALTTAGFRPRPWALHVLARALEARSALPEPQPGALVMADQPQPVRPPTA